MYSLISCMSCIDHQKCKKWFCVHLFLLQHEQRFIYCLDITWYIIMPSVIWLLHACLLHACISSSRTFKWLAMYVGYHTLVKSHQSKLFTLPTSSSLECRTIHICLNTSKTSNWPWVCWSHAIAFEGHQCQGHCCSLHSALQTLRTHANDLNTKLPSTQRSDKALLM